MIESVRAKIEKETDVNVRKELTAELQALLVQKKKIQSGVNI